VIDLPNVKVSLENGLDVIVHEDHGCPIVAVNLWYHVGSKNERPGRTGFAHLFEHLMFEGSEHHDQGYFQPLQEAGGALNGSTNSDRTNYWEVVPRDALDRALWMESDRMGYLLPALTQKKLDTQRDVVLNERRQSYENRPYGFAGMALMATHYPSSHPYHWPTIGFPEDIRSAGLGDVCAFFETYYHPANASLVIAGDVRTEEAVSAVHDYFGEIAAGPAPSEVVVSAVENGSQVVMLEDNVECPRLYLSWPSAALLGKYDAELDLVADILAGGKSTRLYRTLVHDRRIATDVSVQQSSRELSGLFSIVATAVPGTTLHEIENVISEEVARMLVSDVKEHELQRSKNRFEADFAWRQQSVGGFGGKADQLNAYNMFAGTPNFFSSDFERYRQVTPASIREALESQLRPEMRVALSVVPAGVRSAALPESRHIETF